MREKGGDMRHKKKWDVQYLIWKVIKAGQKQHNCNESPVNKKVL